MMKINNVLVIPFALDVEGIENLLQRIQDAGIAITDNERKSEWNVS